MLYFLLIVGLLAVVGYSVSKEIDNMNLVEQIKEFNEQEQEQL